MPTNFYDRFFLPYILDLACGVSPVTQQRQKVVPLAQGKVLEIGMGTGLNVPYYDKQRVQKIVGVDPAMQMHALAQKRIAKAGLKVELVGLSAERLPLDTDSFDTVVCTYTLCSIPDPAMALAEMRRVLRPGGRLLFSEHGLAPDASVRGWQHRLQPIWGAVSGGCHLSADIPHLIKDAGFKVDVNSAYLPGPKFVSYHYWGMATK